MFQRDLAQTKMISRHPLVMQSSTFATGRFVAQFSSVTEAVAVTRTDQHLSASAAAQHFGVSACAASSHILES